MLFDVGDKFGSLYAIWNELRLVLIFWEAIDVTNLFGQFACI